MTKTVIYREQPNGDLEQQHPDNEAPRITGKRAKRINKKANIRLVTGRLSTNEPYGVYNRKGKRLGEIRSAPSEKLIVRCTKLLGKKPKIIVILW